ncbi:MAG TPA: DedA family protein [Vicinamibacterales bacterium]|nr:DedA family protein [Vicinamibacterales bacterium]
MPEWLLDLFGRYGYAVVFFGIFLENTGLPVPGETALLAGAALSNFGRLELRWVVVTAVAGAILGDNLGFLIGHHYGRGLIERYGSFVGLTRPRLEQFDRFFLRHGGRTVFIARFVTGLRVFGALLAGASGLGWPTFLLYNAAGAVSWSIAIAAAGYTLAYSWETLERWIGRSGLVGLALVVAAGVIGFLRSSRKQGS